MTNAITRLATSDTAATRAINRRCFHNTVLRISQTGCSAADISVSSSGGVDSCAVIMGYIPATAAVIAREDASCAVVSRFLQNNEAPMIFCGTTTTSPGLSFVERTSPSNHPPECRPITEPYARMMKISLRFAAVLVPPARLRYQPAVLLSE